MRVITTKSKSAESFYNIKAVFSDLIQSEVYKSSSFILKRNGKNLYYDCTNYYRAFNHMGEQAFIITQFIKKLNQEENLLKLKEMKFTDIQEQGFMPLYSRDKPTDDLHELCGFRSGYEFITKSNMKKFKKKARSGKITKP